MNPNFGNPNPESQMRQNPEQGNVVNETPIQTAPQEKVPIENAEQPVSIQVEPNAPQAQNTQELAAKEMWGDLPNQNTAPVAENPKAIPATEKLDPSNIEKVQIETLNGAAQFADMVAEYEQR